MEPEIVGEEVAELLKKPEDEIVEEVTDEPLDEVIADELSTEDLPE